MIFRGMEILYDIAQPFFHASGLNDLLQFSQKGQGQEEPKGRKAAQLVNCLLEQGIHCFWLARWQV